MKKTCKLALSTLLSIYVPNEINVYNSEELDISRDDALLLEKYGIVKVTLYTNGDTDCRIKILPYILEFNADNRRAALRYWIPIGISNAIALAALIIAIL